MTQTLEQIATEYGWTPAEEETPEEFIRNLRDFLTQEIENVIWPAIKTNPYGIGKSLGLRERWVDILSSHEAAILTITDQLTAAKEA